ncbi:MAG: carboxypeptidase-like regulatory domain-containing protein [Bacteroidetes bacterium]|nr:carboxypeptidase-like regulatory domain-containing protein [Bacteroidota bacterium]
MKKSLISLLFLLIAINTLAQIKIGGVVLDANKNPLPYVNVIFVGSNIGTITNENGKFYLECHKDINDVEFSFIGFEKKRIKVKNRDLNLVIVLNEESSQLREVVIYTGKTKKKGNPAIDILEKVWSKKRQNGLYLFDQYEYDKYEKIEFDLNNIDSTLMNSKLFKGLEVVFEHIDTSHVSGKAYLPIFINESLYKTYGSNKTAKKRNDLLANKTSGFDGNQYIITYVKDLYADYNIYDNYIKLFDKSFVSPVAKTGVNAYNYVLRDSSFIDNKWCYNIVYYPRRPGELTFKGDFWISDTTFAVKKINMEVSKSANINWVKDLYIEQQYEVLNDSVFLLKRDFLMSDFSLNKKDKSKGVYGRRTTNFKNYTFDIPRTKEFYEHEIDIFDTKIYNKEESFWSKNRFERLNKNEEGIYKMLDTLHTIPKFKRMYDLTTILASGYIEFDNFDYGSIWSTFGFNDVEGYRFRVGGRTYFGQNDLWRIQGYLAYGEKDNKFKYGISGKYMFDKKNRLILNVGNRKDVEQIGVSLTTTNDILGRSFASSSFFASGDNSKLTNINLTSIGLQYEPSKNFEIKIGTSFRTLESASETFNLDYFDENSLLKSSLKQTEVDFSVRYMPGRKTIGYGVERADVNDHYPTIFLNMAAGLKNSFGSDFEYQKVQFYYKQPWQLGGLGRFKSIVEVGKTFGEVPLGLLDVIPGNQSYFTIDNAFATLNYYEFVTDTYASLQLEHNFNGRFFSRIPYIRKLNLREIVGVKAVWGEVSDKNIALNASNIIYNAPEDIYWEYSVGVGNIFKVFRLDFSWRGNYLDNPDANKFVIRGTFGFHF